MRAAQTHPQQAPETLQLFETVGAIVTGMGVSWGHPLSHGGRKEEY